jgi:DNA-directed RNA polymerase specialized sigma24 family protein
MRQVIINRGFLMAASKREELKRRVEKILDRLLALLIGLLRNAPRFRFLSKHVEDIVQEAFKSLLTQIDRGNLDWVLDTPDPDETVERLLVTIFLKDAVTKICKHLKDPCSHGYLEIIDGLLQPDGQEDEEKRIANLLDFERFVENLPEAFRQIVRWAFEEGRKHCWLLLKVVREIAQLPEEHQRILYLFYIEGKPHEEIAEELHSTPAAVKQKLYRIKRELRRRLRPGGDGDAAT